ncbi:MAG: hypothetical protein GWO07_04140 [Candidatus Dadabacteria bacterium]|nr:hypothetical protein [Candidatus Dadabacteria bacterium]NIS07954.1 hypothetical protein [Candidatus Dadabacteria bacterium]NIV43047.1 hypothetical protein [Candidatus Dadabacteria bacterium]NIX14910.1 hypothetical protein [Candidatus Dadabacteria bacterium]NIY21538.1 hypothetical protein [Candidatus Dadabacteria bacterium]
MDFSKIREFFDGIKTATESKFSISEITERDRYILFGCTGLLALILIYLTVFSFSSTVSSLEKKVLTLERDLQKVGELKVEYLTSKKQLETLIIPDKNPGPLISVVEKILLAEGVERKRFSIKDRKQRNKDTEDIYDEKSVEVQIKKIPLEKMIDVLYALQSKNTNLKVRGLKIRTLFDNRNSIDLIFRVSTFEFKEVG